MGRWEPDTAERLRAAALELFATAGYEETTVAGIADRAGVTSRTFFRYFADKPEVLFAGSEHLEHEMVAAVAAVPAGASPRTALDAALYRAATILSARADFARRRHAVIGGNGALRERETMKTARLSDALATALREHGVPEPLATMSAHAGVAAFHMAFDAWANDPTTDLRQAMVENVDALAAVVR